MPSGAKKRKAAKKKAQKQVHSTTDDGSHLQGIEESKSYDERENAAKISEGAKSKEVDYDDVMVSAEGDVKNGKHKGLSSSSSSSSSDDEEVAVEKEKVVVAEEGELEEQVPVSRENPVVSEEVFDSVEERIPVEESVKQVVLDNIGSESGAIENSVISHVSEAGMKQSLGEVLPAADGKDKVSPGMTDYVQEKIETKVVQVAEVVSEFVETAAREGEGFLPQSSGVTSADAYCEDNHVKELETQKYIEEQPLVSSALLPVRRTSLMNCCGLFEVFSGGASR